MSTNALSVTPLIRGNIDVLEPVAENLVRLRGWILRPDKRLQSVDISLRGVLWVSALTLEVRPDVQAAYAPNFGPLAHLLWTGFEITAPLPPGVTIDSSTIVTVAPSTAEGERLAALHTYYFDLEAERTRLPQPPAELQQRIGGSKEFLHVATQLATLLLTCIGKYRPLWEPGEILDWGCGCGRVIAQLMRLVRPEKISGCDIDGEAIEWDRAHLPGPSFRRVEPSPPTSYPDNQFDVIYGVSVMTHLDEETQLAWLEELQRIARPGAILALSIIGEDLRQTNMPVELAEEYNRNGFATFVPYYSEMLADFAPKSYYKESYHSLDYVASRWSPYFDVLECVETKHQDIVLLRAR